MITPALVQAQVVDIRDPASATPPDLVADANVLYWLFYPNFSSLTYARGVRDATPVQFPNYSAYWKRAARAGTRYHVAAATIGEFAKTAEYAELEAVWLTDPTSPQPDPSNPVTEFSPRMTKFARYQYAGQLRIIRNAVRTMVDSLRKSVLLLDQLPTADDLHRESVAEWLSSVGDFPDAVLVAAAKHHGRPHILSDDMDLATFAGVTLYTSNPNAIRIAGAAGKLLAPPVP
ncbi:Uncharacterized protein OS=Singulisphaera acidiphila (strain ATCC BAA-1392 / DSM 18658 / VKM B-2454 / MOB10) GN=Sinac_4289 PE=4 SV=1 [Gemmataceae bacterium]|nr:Uncharacterized protein OS=Singulisphaera acidiphila (strain ATCC BAA-1392 / DSM 18658 / VKM B-2454 / MOB10) GN=Sinac_4289 PE=4 SV=1 [Gemmataceae bacterium]VTT97573.1 Uncharacterized protein OS=Singulisphaera acidiphila (strain ATCC BAA-1392 / DSM 18658 / VKM B-2454 / MOB10) GN=Sinac_4289 PE=4 SV=1 [Gemmataceae bacterium]